MYVIQCDFCKCKSVGSDSVIPPEGWASLETQGDSFSSERLHICPTCRDNLVIEDELRYSDD